MPACACAACVLVSVQNLATNSIPVTTGSRQDKLMRVIRFAQAEWECSSQENMHESPLKMLTRAELHRVWDTAKVTMAQPRRAGSKSKAGQREGESVAESKAVQDGRILGALEAIATEYASSSGPVGAPGMDVGAGDKGDESHPTQRTAQRRPRCSPGARQRKSPRGKSPVGPQ